MRPDIISQWDIITGFFLPLLMSIILQRHWQTATKAVVSFVVMLAVSGVSAWLQGQLDPANFTATVFVIMSTAITSFKSLWQPTGIAEQLETATSTTANKEYPEPEPKPLPDAIKNAIKEAAEAAAKEHLRQAVLDSVPLEVKPSLAAAVLKTKPKPRKPAGS